MVAVLVMVVVCSCDRVSGNSGFISGCLSGGGGGDSDRDGVEGHGCKSRGNMFSIGLECGEAERETTVLLVVMVTVAVARVVMMMLFVAVWVWVVVLSSDSGLMLMVEMMVMLLSLVNCCENAHSACDGSAR